MRTVLVACVLLAASAARAQDREPPPRIELALIGEWSDPLRLALRADLAASMRGQGLELVHAEDGASRVVATIRVSAPSPEAPSAEVRIDDLVTGKHVERAVDLRRVPEDGWSVAIAAGADELLRASWAELAMPDAPPPAIDPPAAIEAIVEDRIVQPIAEAARAVPIPRPMLALGARASLEGYLGGQTHLGGDLLLQLWLAERVGIELALGGRGGLDASSARGSVRSVALGGELGPSFLLVAAPSPIRLEAFVLARVAWVDFVALANAGSIATGASGVAVIGRAGLRAGIAIDLAQIVAELALGVPFLGIEARDERGPITGVTGLEVHAAVGLTYEVAR